MTEHIDAYALRSGHPPSAARRVLVDFDKTIRPWGDLISFVDPLPGAADAMRALDAAGYDVVILTSRLSPTWWRDEAERRGADAEQFGAEQTAYVIDYLNHFGIPFTTITAEKMPGLVFFDDTAVRVGPDWTLAQAIWEFLAQRGATA
jgi:hypothetical protein